MRITQIKLKNFKAFFGEHEISLDREGKNLMVYGENGSGKSSLFHALMTFFKAGKEAQPMRSLENIFIPESQKETASIELKIKESSTSSSSQVIRIDVLNNEVLGPERILIANANKVKGFFDYKSLLKTHLVEKSEINLFTIIVNDILFDQVNRISGGVIGAEWDSIIHDSHELKQGVHVRRKIAATIENFNTGLKEKLTSIESDTNLFIDEFGYNIKVTLNFDGLIYHGRRKISGNEIGISVKFFETPIPAHQHFLNEARLSALAISLYLATIKSNPSVGVLKILVLDDLLIGLDMSNRLPLLQIIKNHFEPEFQIVMTTYDKIWFDLVKNHFGSSSWKYIEIFRGILPNADFEMPILKQDEDYISKAEEFLGLNIYKASAVYIRSEFEKLVKEICDKKDLRVKYKLNSKGIKSDDYWKSITSQTNIPLDLVREIETNRATVMNPFSHHDLGRPEFRVELINTIESIKKLKTQRSTIRKTVTIEDLKRKVSDLERRLTGKDATIAALRTRISSSPTS